MTPAYLRARVLAIERLLAALPAPEGRTKNDARSLLGTYGYVAPEIQARYRLVLAEQEAVASDNSPLRFEEITRRNTWFVLHPEKVAGQEILTTSREFPIQLEGTRADVERIIRATLDAGPSGSSSNQENAFDMARARMNLKTKALRLRYKYRKTAPVETAPVGLLGIDRPHWFSTLGGLGGLDGLGDLREDTRQQLTANEGLIRRVLDEQQRHERTYKAGETYSFADIIRHYNAGISSDEIRAWVWYRRSIGIPMTGWEQFMPKNTKTGGAKTLVTKAKASGGIQILDNHFRLIGNVLPGQSIGTPTKKTHTYDKEVYQIFRATKNIVFDTRTPDTGIHVGEGDLCYVRQWEVALEKAADNVDDAELTRLVKAGCLFYADGRLLPLPVFAFGNMYDRDLQLLGDRDAIVGRYGAEVYERHGEIIQKAKPRLISIQNSDARERPKILSISQFAKDFMVETLREEAGVDLQAIVKKQIDELRYKRGKVAAAQLDELKEYLDADSETYRFTLQSAYRLWLRAQPRESFNEVSAEQIIYYYLDAHNLSKDLSEEEKDTISKYCPLHGEDFFTRFLFEAVTYEDQKKIDFTWNRIYNGHASIQYHKVPVGFTCSAYFGSGLFRASAAQREALAFMEIANSGVLAYDVGVGKTISAIISVCNSLFSGKCSKPLVVVPNPTYAKWIREMFGYTHPVTKKQVPGIFTGTGVTLNDWGNLGTDVMKRLRSEGKVVTKKGSGYEWDELKPVADKSITIVTYEGVGKIGFGQKVMGELFDELVSILTQNSAQPEGKGKKGRDMAKQHEKWEALLGVGQKGSICDIDAVGFDYLVCDEAHNFKNVFDAVPVDENGKKRYAVSGSQSDRGVKLFFLCNYIQKTHGQNVLLLTATPFTNSPLEIYSILSLVGYKSMQDMGIVNLERFMETFVMQSLEYVNNHRGEIVMDYTVKSFNNRLPLQRLIHNHINYKTGEEAGVKRPVKINLPRLAAMKGGQIMRLPPGEQVLTFLRPTEEQQENQQQIELMASARGRGALAEIGRALGKNLDNALSPFLAFGRGEMPSYEEFVEGSPKIHYACECIASVKAWHEERGEAVSGQIVYMNRGKDYFPMVKTYLEKAAGYKKGVKHNGKTFDEIEFITSEVTGDRKEAIKDAFQANVVKVVIGTATIKEGIDLQNHCTVIYNLYPDWNPTDIKQLEGRGWRQGNSFGYVRVVMPLVQDTMDVFVFQKLEEKTARINDIWYRSDRGNVLDQEALDPMEIKFALFSKIEPLAAIKLDQIKKELNRKLVVVKANIETLERFTVAYQSYLNCQQRCRMLIPSIIARLLPFLEKAHLLDGKYRDHYSSGQTYDERIFRSQYTRINQLPDDKRQKLIESAWEIKQTLEEFVNSPEQSDKQLILLGPKAVFLLHNISAGGYDLTAAPWGTLFSDLSARLSEVRKTERTTLQPKGYSASDNLAELIDEYRAEKAMYEAEAERVTSKPYWEEVVAEVAESKRRNAITGASVEARSGDFAKLNYLLEFKADAVRDADASGDIPKPGEKPQEGRVLLLPAAQRALPAAAGPTADVDITRLRMQMKAKALKLKYKYKKKQAA